MTFDVEVRCPRPCNRLLFRAERGQDRYVEVCCAKCKTLLGVSLTKQDVVSFKVLRAGKPGKAKRQ